MTITVTLFISYLMWKKTRLSGVKSRKKLNIILDKIWFEYKNIPNYSSTVQAASNKTNPFSHAIRFPACSFIFSSVLLLGCFNDVARIGSFTAGGTQIVSWILKKKKKKSKQSVFVVQLE